MAARSSSTQQNSTFVLPATLLVALVLLLTAAAYAGTLGFGFVYDDQLQIVSSPAVHSWRFLPRYFTTHVWYYSQPGSPPTYYRPIFLLWILINYSLAGLNSALWHSSTVGLHLVATLLVFILGQRLTGDRTLAVAAALLFGVHPVHIEAVAWLSGATEPLLAIAVTSSLLCYICSSEQDRTKRRLGWYVLSLLLYAVALLEKESSIVFPAIIFAYEWIFRPVRKNADSRRARLAAGLARSTPYVLLAAAYLVARSLVLNGFRLKVTPLGPLTMVLTEPTVILFYVKRLFWPVGLSCFYDIRYITTAGLSTVFAPALVLSLCAVLLYFWSRRSRVAAFASIWMILFLLPALNLRGFEPEELVHDRYLYLPSMGFSLLAAMALGRLNTGRSTIWRRPLMPAAILAVLVTVSMAGIAVESRHWSSNIDLFRRARVIAPENSLAKHSLAVELGTLGLYSEAIPLLREVLVARPRSFEANAAIGRYYYSTGAFEQAETYLTRALEIHPQLSRIPYAYIGLARLELGHLDTAEAVIREGINLQSTEKNSRMIHGALGAVLERKGDLHGALAQFKLELANNPVSTGARHEITQIQARLAGTE